MFLTHTHGYVIVCGAQLLPHSHNRQKREDVGKKQRNGEGNNEKQQKWEHSAKTDRRIRRGGLQLLISLIKTNLKFYYSLEQGFVSLMSQTVLYEIRLFQPLLALLSGFKRICGVTDVGRSQVFPEAGFSCCLLCRPVCNI